MEISSNLTQAIGQETSFQKGTQIHVLSHKEGDIYLVKIGNSVTEIKSSTVLTPGSSFFAPVINDNGRLLVYINTFQGEINPQFSFFQKNNIPMDSVSTYLVQYILSLGGIINPLQIKKALVMGHIFSKKNDNGAIEKEIVKKTYELLEKGMIPESWEIEELLDLQFLDFSEDSGAKKQKQEQKNKEKKEAFLQIFNHLSQGKFQKIVVPFKLLEAETKGSIHFWLDLVSKKVVQWELFAKEDNNDDKTKIIWHFSISNCKNEKSALRISSFPRLKKNEKNRILDFFSAKEFKTIFYEISFFDDEKITETENLKKTYEATNIVV